MKGESARGALEVLGICHCEFSMYGRCPDGMVCLCDQLAFSSVDWGSESSESALALVWGNRHPSVGEAEQAMLTPEVVSSVVGAPWSMRRLDGIGRESWDWGVPHALASPSSPPKGRRGSSPKCVPTAGANLPSA